MAYVQVSKEDFLKVAKCHVKIKYKTSLWAAACLGYTRAMISYGLNGEKTLVSEIVDDIGKIKTVKREPIVNYYVKKSKMNYLDKMI